MAERKRGLGWFVVVSAVLLVTGFVAGQSVALDGGRRIRQPPQVADHTSRTHRAKALESPKLTAPTTYQEGPGLRAAARVDRTAVLKGTDGQLFVAIARGCGRRRCVAAHRFHRGARSLRLHGRAEAALCQDRCESLDRQACAR